MNEPEQPADSAEPVLENQNPAAQDGPESTGATAVSDTVGEDPLARAEANIKITVETDETDVNAVGTPAPTETVGAKIVITAADVADAESVAVHAPAPEDSAAYADEIVITAEEVGGAADASEAGKATAAAADAAPAKQPSAEASRGEGDAAAEQVAQAEAAVESPGSQPEANAKRDDQATPVAGSDDERHDSPEQKPQTASRRDVRRVAEAFAACVRCGYFLSDYRMLFGETHLAQVIYRSRDEWLDMDWSNEMRKTVEKSFGIRLDQNIEYYQGCCDMCRRNFVYSVNEAGESSLRVQIRMSSAPQQQHHRRRR